MMWNRRMKIKRSKFHEDYFYGNTGFCGGDPGSAD